MRTFSIDIPTVASFLGGIPVQFKHNDKQHFGLFSQVQGGGGTAVYHLIIDRYYRGRLRLSAYDNKWVFDGESTDKAEWFSKHVAEYS